MPDHLDDLVSDGQPLPPAPDLAVPDRTSLADAVLAKGGMEAAQPFQRGTLSVKALKPADIAFENDVFQVGFAEANGDLSNFDDGKEDPEGEAEVECGAIQQQAGYPRIVATFMARVTGWTVVSDNFWRYNCQRVCPPLAGDPTASARYIADSSIDTACDPISFQAWNTNEFDNDGEAIEGPGMDIDAQPYVDCGLSMKPLQQGVYPCWRYRQASGSYVHLIHGANDHSP